MLVTKIKCFLCTVSPVLVVLDRDEPVGPTCPATLCGTVGAVVAMDLSWTRWRGTIRRRVVAFVANGTGTFMNTMDTNTTGMGKIARNGATRADVGIRSLPHAMRYGVRYRTRPDIGHVDNV
jgi:hypothetical protein